MFLMWGTDLICFYNDAYRPNLGEQGKHPSILGTPAIEAANAESDDECIKIFKEGYYPRSSYQRDHLRKHVSSEIFRQWYWL
jgi:hypothetical protein